MSLTIDTNGNFGYNANNAIHVNGSATANVVSPSVGTDVSVGGGGNEYVQFDKGARTNAFQDAAQKAPSVPNPVGSVDGKTYYDQAAYEQALADKQRREQEEQRRKRQAEEEAKQKREAEQQKVVPAQQAVGLEVTEDVVTKQQQQSQRQQTPEGSLAPEVAINAPAVVPAVSVEDVSPVEQASDVMMSPANILDPVTGEITSSEVPMYRDARRVSAQPAGIVDTSPLARIWSNAREILSAQQDVMQNADTNGETAESTNAPQAGDTSGEPAEEEEAPAESTQPNPRAGRQYDPYAEDMGDIVYMEYSDLGNIDVKNKQKMLDELRRQEVQRSGRYYKSVAENPVSMRGRGVDDETPARNRPWDKPEWEIKRKLSIAADKLKLRLINPSLLSIDGQHVEMTSTRENGKTINKGRIRYTEAVEEKIKDIRNIYGCSQRTVLSLVMLRAGLGVDTKGLIGKKSPTKFKLSEAQFVELANDIIRSQEQYGHPMGLVRSISGSNGVRDNSGNFVVVSGTRCFPCGYIPTFILNDLMDCPDFEGMTIGDVQARIGNTWINETYPELTRLAAADGENVMWQARAIENMMRAVMSFDGIDPLRLDIPELAINKSMMMMQTEKAVAGDAEISKALDERERRERVANDRFRARYRKEPTRNDDGSYNSPARKRFALGDFARGISSAEKACKVADIFLILTNPLEAAESMAEQNVADGILRRMFDMQHKGVLDNYQVSDRLRQAATSKQGIEARGVAESLFRIDGWNAIDAFMSQEGTNGKPKYRFTNADLRKFLADYGVTGEGLPDRLMDFLKINPKQAPAFMANVRAAMNFAESFALSTGAIFQEQEASHFMDMAMMEMARASIDGNESYTGAEVDQWAANGGEEVIRGLLRTDAGREAFMSQGVTSLGRKSPFDHALRKVLASNGITELVIRSTFDRFPEYGMNKVMRQIPFSNTLSYLGAHGVDSVGSMLFLVNQDNNVSRYQVGSRNTFADGLMKNLTYDLVMAGNRLIIGCLYYGLLQAIGGVRRPPSGNGDDDDKNLYSWEEWIIGAESDEYAMPVKWAWFMDDLSGIGLPLGMAFAICASESGTENPLEWTSESKDLAARVFMNAIGSFNDGTALFDAIDMLNRLDEEIADATNPAAVGSWLNPSPTERRQTSLELGVWRFFGDMTPTIMKQLLPWSRDFLFRGNDPWARSASKVYNNGADYTMEEAIEQYRVRDVDSYNEYMLRREAQNNPVAALLLDVFNRAGFASSPDQKKTGYMFTEQPYRTDVDDNAQFMWDFYSFELEDLKGTDEEKLEQSRAWAEWICQEIDANFTSAQDAADKGFVINPETREACREYTQWMTNPKSGYLKQLMDAEVNEMKELLGVSYLDDSIYDDISKKYEDRRQHYKMLYENYFKDDTYIPYRLPRYKVLDSDIETRYIDENGNAAVDPRMVGLYNAWSNIPGIGNLTNAVTNTLGIDTDFAPGTAERYSYGNRPNALWYYSPEPTERLDNETEPYLLRRDADGNVVSDYQGLYEMLGNMPDRPGATPEEMEEFRQRALDLRAQTFGEPSEDGTIGTPSTGQRGLVPYETAMPSWYKDYYDPEQAKKILGFQTYDADTATTDSNDSSSGKSSGGGGNGYSGSYHYTGGTSYASSYNPRIYSNPRSVYSSRASGMSTRSPYKATSTYLRPGFYTKGSREAYSRQN